MIINLIDFLEVVTQMMDMIAMMIVVTRNKPVPQWRPAKRQGFQSLS